MPSAFHGDCSQRAWSTGWAGLNLICTLVGVMWVGLNWCLSMTETDLAWQVFAPECSPICISKSCWWKASAGPSVTATFGSNTMEYCKKSTMYAVYIYGVCSHVQNCQSTAPPWSRGRCCQASLLPPGPPAQGCLQHSFLHSAPSALLHLCQLWLFLRSAALGRKRKIWEYFSILSHFPPARAAQDEITCPFLTTWLLPPSGLAYDSYVCCCWVLQLCYRWKRCLHLSALHPLIHAAQAQQEWRREIYYYFLTLKHIFQ